jgi:hypothetical protein
MVAKTSHERIFFARNGSHLPLLRAMTSLVIEASVLLAEMMRFPDPDKSVPAARIKQLDHSGDLLSHRVLYRRKKSMKS